MTHLISVNDFKDYTNETVLASSSADRKTLIAIISPANSMNVMYKVKDKKTDTTWYSGFSFIEAIDAYNSI